jgi:drug/metabolite transporter (DMT)-like permease
VALFEPTLYFIAENYGLQRVSASIAAIIIATIPVFTALLARPLLREPLRFTAIIGFALSLGGVAMIVLDPSAGRDFTPFGLILMFLAVLTTSGYSIGIKRLPARYRPLTVVKLQSLLSLPVIAVLALLVEGVPRSVPSPLVAGHLLYLAIFPSSIAFVFLGAGIKALGAGRAMMFTNLIPGVTAVAAWLLIGEQFTVRKIVGMAIVLAGVFVAQRESLEFRSAASAEIE